ncbi:MAG: FlgD immunoglobulin-like domain containing protein [bacterium]
MFQTIDLRFVFSVTNDAILDYDPALDSFVSGRGTNTLTVSDGTGRQRLTADAGADKGISLGQIVTLGGNPTASGGFPPYTFSWTPATGVDNTNVANPTATPTSTTEYTVEVTDTKGCKVTDMVTVTINPLLIVDAGGPYSVNEGATVTVAASGSDLQNAPLTYAWDLDNNGSFETPGQSVTFSAANLDGPSSQIIKVQVTDNGGLTATDEATVNVLNVAPTASFNISSVTLIAGQCATLAFSNQADPSAADVTVGLLYSYDCTNDGAFEVSDVAATSHVCVYPVSGTFTAKGRIKDKDGDFTDYTVQIVVQTPQQAIQSLIDQVNALVAASVLKPNEGHPLIVKLEGAKTKLDNGKITPAMNELQAFINQVNAYINSTKLTPAQGQPLIDAANAIISVVSNPCQSAAAGFKNGASDGMTAVDQSNGALPTEFQLEQNYPNPFNPSTTIQFSLLAAGKVSVVVYSITGQLIRELVNGETTAGRYTVAWDGRNQAGEAVAAGMYLYRLIVHGANGEIAFSQTRRMAFVK